MGRSLRLNNSSGGSSSSGSGLSLDDISAAFDAPRLLKTVDITSFQTDLQFPNLDTTTYEHFRLHIDHLGAEAGANWLQAGPMSGSTKNSPERHVKAYWRGNTSGDFGQGTSSYYVYAGADMMNGAADPYSNITMVWDFHYPDPSVANTSNDAAISGKVWVTPSYSYGHKSFMEMFEWRNSTHQNGFWLMPQQGFNKHGTSGSYPMRCTLFGNKRRPAATT